MTPVEKAHTIQNYKAGDEISHYEQNQQKIRQPPNFPDLVISYQVKNTQEP